MGYTSNEKLREHHELFKNEVALKMDEILAKNEKLKEKHRWIPVSEHPKNDTYYMALIGDTGDDFGNTLEWLYFDERWFYAKTKKPYPRTIFIVQYMRISLPCSEPLPTGSQQFYPKTVTL